MRKLFQSRSAGKGTAVVFTTMDAAAEPAPAAPPSVPPHSKPSAGRTSLPVADGPQPASAVRLGPPDASGPPAAAAGAAGELWSITLAAFWAAVLCCLVIVAVALFGPKRAVVLPDSEPSVIAVGSTRQQVRAVQGEPTAIEGNVWHYGASRIYFDGNLVTGWRVARGSPLKVQSRMSPRKR